MGGRYERAPAKLPADPAVRAGIGEFAGAPVRGFAYPYGSRTAAHRAVRNAGHDYACAVQTTMSELRFMTLPRIQAGQRQDGRRVAAKRFLFTGRFAAKGRRP